MVCADFVGSTVTSAAGAFFAGLVQAISGPAARRLPLLSVTSVCAGLAGGCAASGWIFAFAFAPNAEAAAAPTPRPAYFRISRRVVTLDSQLSLIHTHGLDLRPVCSRDRILQKRYSQSQMCTACALSECMLARAGAFAVAGIDEVGRSKAAARPPHSKYDGMTLRLDLCNAAGRSA